MATATKEAREQWLDCQLDKGMYSDKVALTYPPEGQAVRSVFVPMASVKGVPGSRGKVKIFVDSRLDGNIVAVLPSAQRDVIVVTEKDVSDKA